MSHTGHRRHAPRTVAVAVITVSDTRTPENDESGLLIVDLCEKAGHTVTARRIVPDDPDAVRAALDHFLDDAAVEAVLVNGGTGISGRDRTFEAISELIETPIPGFGELFRSLSYAEIGAAAMLSRAAAGLASGRPVFSMPGSPAAVRLAMEKLILPEIGHVLAESRRTS